MGANGGSTTASVRSSKRGRARSGAVVEVRLIERDLLIGVALPISSRVWHNCVHVK